jgi:hypothetical protein
MYLTDLTFIEDGNKNLLPDGNINFAKRQRLSEVISEIQTYQNTPYCLEEVSFINEYLFNVEAIPEEQCYALSLKRENKRGLVEDQTPDLPFGEIEVKADYLFDKEDTEDTVTFDRNELDEIIAPINATLVKLVERLTYHQNVGE